MERVVEDAYCFSRGPEFGFPYLQIPITLASWNLIPFSGLCGYQTHTWCTDIYEAQHPYTNKNKYLKKKPLGILGMDRPDLVYAVDHE